MSSERPCHMHVYGIRNCDSCRSTLKWLAANEVPHTFHDFRQDGLSEETLKNWLSSPQSPLLINKRSTSWRQLADEQKLLAETDPLTLLKGNLTLIKRPVITDGDNILNVGFSPANLEASI